MNVHPSWKKVFDSCLFHANAFQDALGRTKAGMASEQYTKAQKLYSELVGIQTKINWTDKDKE